MATVTVANILVGAATLKLDETDVGAISGGLTVSKATDVYEVEVDNVKAPVKHIPTKEIMKVKTSVAEATLANLRLIWNIPASKLTQPGGTIDNLLKVGISTGIVEHTLTVTGVAPNGLTRVYRCFRAISVRASEHGYMRNKETLFPIEIDILPDLTQAAGEEFGTITDYNF